MSDVITFNTESNEYMKQGTSQVDPWDHLDVDGWVQKQIEWGEANPSGRGLIPYLHKLGTDLVGAEIGVCLGVTTELILKDKDTNIEKYYAVDNYPTYIDWNGLPITIERQEKLYERTKQVLPHIKYKPKFFLGDGSKGIPSHAPYDKIIVTAGAPTVPELLLNQLNIGGILVIPVGDENSQKMVTILKTGEKDYEKHVLDTFRFVPLVGDKAW